MTPLLHFLILAALLLTALVAILIAVAFCLRIQNLQRARHWQRLEALWEPGILQALQKDAASETAIPVIEDPRHWLDFLLRFRQRIRGIEHTTLDRLAQPCLPILQTDCHAPDEMTRARALYMLGVFQFQSSTELLVNALEDPSEWIAFLMLQLLVKSAEPAHLSAVAARLSRFQNWHSLTVAHLLAQPGLPAIEPYRNRLLSHSSLSDWEKTVLTQTLTLLGDTQLAIDLAKHLPTEGNEALLIARLQLLQKWGTSDAVPQVLALCSHQDFRVRAHAITTLAAIGNQTVVPHIRPFLNDPSDWVALHAGRALVHLQDRETLQQLAREQSARTVLGREMLEGQP